jgi:hypothetical protein
LIEFKEKTTSLFDSAKKMFASARTGIASAFGNTAPQSPTRKLVANIRTTTHTAPTANKKTATKKPAVKKATPAKAILPAVLKNGSEKKCIFTTRSGHKRTAKVIHIDGDWVVLRRNTDLFARRLYTRLAA